MNLQPCKVNFREYFTVLSINCTRKFLRPGAARGGQTLAEQGGGVGLGGKRKLITDYYFLGLQRSALITDYYFLELVDFHLGLGQEGFSLFYGPQTTTF